MKKIILTLSVCLSCIMVANAEYPHVVDTLPNRIINGLEVTPVRTTYEWGGVFWDLKVSDFEKCFQRFKNKCRGEINFDQSPSEVDKAIYDWQDKLWEIYPPEIKTLKDFNLKLFIDSDGRVFAVEFSMPDKTFQKLEGLPEDTLKSFYQNLIKEECKAFKELDFHVSDSNNDFDSLKYTTIWLKKGIYDMFGTFNLLKERIIREKEERMKNKEKEQ